MRRELEAGHPALGPLGMAAALIERDWASMPEIAEEVEDEVGGFPGRREAESLEMTRAVSLRIRQELRNATHEIDNYALQAHLLLRMATHMLANGCNSEMAPA